MNILAMTDVIVASDRQTSSWVSSPMSLGQSDQDIANFLRRSRNTLLPFHSCAFNFASIESTCSSIAGLLVLWLPYAKVSYTGFGLMKSQIIIINTIDENSSVFLL